MVAHSFQFAQKHLPASGQRHDLKSLPNANPCQPLAVMSVTWCRFQCGYDDVGYTNALAVSGGAWVDPTYPFDIASYAKTDPVTVPAEDLDGCYGRAS
jgi:hypothetical protein